MQDELDIESSERKAHQKENMGGFEQIYPIIPSRKYLQTD